MLLMTPTWGKLLGRGMPGRRLRGHARQGRASTSRPHIVRAKLSASVLPAPLLYPQHL